MALRAIVHKAELNVADTDRGYYGSHALTLARHPSETDERMMVRLLAFALLVQPDDSLTFTRGLSDTEEPDLWRHDLTGSIRLWVETGLPDERRLLKACSRAESVMVFAYGRNADLWWQGLGSRVTRLPKLQVLRLDTEGTLALAALAERAMVLHVNVTDGQAWVHAGKGEASVSWSSLTQGRERK